MSSLLLNYFVLKTNINQTFTILVSQSSLQTTHPKSENIIRCLLFLPKSAWILTKEWEYWWSNDLVSKISSENWKYTVFSVYLRFNQGLNMIRRNSTVLALNTVHCSQHQLLAENPKINGSVATPPNGWMYAANQRLFWLTKIMLMLALTKHCQRHNGPRVLSLWLG